MKLTINKQRFEYFTQYSISLKYAAVASSFSFTGLKDFLPKILTYPTVQIFDDNNDLLITGTIVSQSNNVTSKPELISVSGYSLPGVIEDCDISVYPLQSDNLSLKDITDKILKPFGIEYEIDPTVLADMNKVYKKSVAGVMETVKTYINNLASQRNIILTHTPEGKLLFTRLDTSKLRTVARFQEGGNVISISLNVNGQALYSPIKILRQASSDNPDAGEKTITNPYVPVFRPKTKVLSAGDIFDLDKAARNELSAQLSTINITIDSLKCVVPGQIIEIKAPTLNINNYTRFFVEQTDINATVKGVTYKLTCVLEDVYSEKEPVNIFK